MDAGYTIILNGHQVLLQRHRNSSVDLEPLRKILCDRLGRYATGVENPFTLPASFKAPRKSRSGPGNQTIDKPGSDHRLHNLFLPVPIAAV